MNANDFLEALKSMTDDELHALHERLHQQLTAIEQTTDPDYLDVSEQVAAVVKEQEHRAPAFDDGA
jgi:hypothetical protein